jgi:hypothetical protein
VIDACPRCGARSAKQAEVDCRPGIDDCPMAGYDTWTDALDELNRLAQWEPSAEEIAALDRTGQANGS